MNDPSKYTSNRVFDGTRPVPAGIVDRLRRRILAERFIEHRIKRRTYKDVARAEVMQREMDRLRNAPVALAHLDTADRDESATMLLLQGLQQHYRECLMAGRLDVWATAAHNIVDLLSDPLTKVHKRAALMNADGQTAQVRE